MDSFRRYGNIFRLNGTNQLQRMPVALEHDYILPDERSLRDKLLYVKQLAAELRFYNLSGQAIGDWQPFFDILLDQTTGELVEQTQLQTLLDTKQDWPAHVSLVLVFLKLFNYLKDDLNELPARHLRHYYEQELGLIRSDITLDEVHVIFEAVKNTSATLLKAGTELDGGKDNNGNILVYSTVNDIVVTPSNIKKIHRLVKEQDKSGHSRFFIATEQSKLEGDSWYTFGRKQLDYDNSQRFMTEATSGFAITSPVLQMAEGIREIDLVLNLNTTKNSFPADHSIAFALTAEITGEEGWIKPKKFQAEIITKTATSSILKINLIIEESESAIIALDSELHESDIKSNWPVIRFLLIGQSGHYEVLEGLSVAKCSIFVDVHGVKNLLVNNNNASLNTEKPMSLFGSQPRIGSEFYIGSGEIFSKRLSHLELNLHWQDLPTDLFAYYREYFDSVLTDSSIEESFITNFLIDINILYKRSWNYTLLHSQTLFNASNPNIKSFVISFDDHESIFGENNYKTQPDIINLEPYNSNSKYGFIKLVLNGPSFGAPFATETAFEAFGHKSFALRYANKAIELSQWQSGIKPVLPNEPYTPTISELSINYKATAEFVLGDNQALERFYSLNAFGYVIAQQQLDAKLVPSIDNQAYLFIGLDSLFAPANVSLLFQLDKGTATTSGEALTLGEAQWSYLANNHWQTISSSEILNDSTHGFQKPGLITLEIGQDASTSHNLMPDSMLWLRASIDKPEDSVCRTIGLHNNAVLAKLNNLTNNIDDYNDHLSMLLAKDSISKLKKRHVTIKKVMQPYASFGGRTRQQDNEHFQSSSELLRHRNRAITIWDIEKLVLNKFPEVFKVKCLPHSDANAFEKTGELAVVIIPNLRSSSTVNTLEPRADTVLMRDIKNFLLQKCSAYSIINVINPLFEYIKVDTNITFKSGVDAGYFSQILNAELQRFLSPWAYEDGQDILFGSRIYKSEILAFIEGRDYVDYVTKFTLYHIYDGPRRDGIAHKAIDFDFIIQARVTPAIGAMTVAENYVVGQGVEVAETTKPHAILVSHPSHNITAISVDDTDCTGVNQLGIGYMAVALDFDVYPE
ncbi:hypothetical protein MNBD_GAMMA22-3080 [hydrothermal vent metagenome]|uniref:Baseplate protein J-like domain-containing protein n=1 Tax=hydrothermal vent metagenome TaxID=652676 RepID=A0A3B1B832_9ZZZZ